MKNRVVLTESQLRRVVENAVKRILSETAYNKKKSKDNEERYDYCERVSGGKFLCKKGNKWILCNNTKTPIGSWNVSKEKAKNDED